MKTPGGIFVGGTGTGVGKTLLSILLMTWLQNRNLRAAPMKPAETGCSPTPKDALALLAAASGIHPIDEVCPYKLALPAAPEAAARREGRKINFKVLRRTFDSLRKRADIVIVEGAGAVATPYGPGLTGIDIARRLRIPVILVTGEALGTVGQTLAAVKAIKYSKALCLGVVLSSDSSSPSGPHCETNAPLIESHLGSVPFLGTLPHIPIQGGSLEKLPYTVISSWAKKNVGAFERTVGPRLEEALEDAQP